MIPIPAGKDYKYSLPCLWAKLMVRFKYPVSGKALCLAPPTSSQHDPDCSPLPNFSLHQTSPTSLERSPTTDTDHEVQCHRHPRNRWLATAVVGLEIRGPPQVHTIFGMLCSSGPRRRCSTGSGNRPLDCPPRKPSTNNVADSLDPGAWWHSTGRVLGWLGGKATQEGLAKSCVFGLGLGLGPGLVLA
ncbi:hypothetical protein BD289DRAFT_115647 [Coniella lustricola]|uniref:Uncharacterized protein n=1 Tax=Coniella lustricola TaxID=2025994 RepID=A0A2T2ZWZ0_9PEZI|nr:hypothetical protein BD289DRAFT_115647 [Coniella lustricola]